MNSCNKTVSYKQHKSLRLMYMDRSINYLAIFCETNFMFHYIYVLKVKIKNRERKSIFHIWLSLIQNNTSLFIEEKVRVNALIFVFNSSNYLNVSVLDSNLVGKFLTFKALCTVISHLKMHICQLMVHVLHVYMYQFLFTFTSNHFGVDSGYWSSLSGRTIWNVGYSIKFFPWRFSHNDFFWSNWWYLEWRKTQHWNWCRNLWSVQIELANKKPKDDILFSECQFKIQDAALMWSV